jgi:hypothetical protein
MSHFDFRRLSLLQPLLPLRSQVIGKFSLTNKVFAACAA